MGSNPISHPKVREEVHWSLFFCCNSDGLPKIVYFCASKLKDNGKDNAAFQAVLQAAKIEYQNINELDSLNDAKDARNEPYLGLKLKKQGAFMALWLRQGSTVRVKFVTLPSS